MDYLQESVSAVALVREAVQAALDERDQQATDTLGRISVTRPTLVVPPKIDRDAAEPPVTAGKRSSVPLALQLQVYKRDAFTCRYCRRQTLFVPTLRLISALYPTEFPYHPHWHMEKSHLLYWVLSTSLEHIVPVASGGTNAVGNLAATCYSCNDWKSNYSLDRLGWTLHPPANTSWDGLSSDFPALYELCATKRGMISKQYFVGWLRAFNLSTISTVSKEHS